jgi:hypothetical protein
MLISWINGSPLATQHNLLSGLCLHPLPPAKKAFAVGKESKDYCQAYKKMTKNVDTIFFLVELNCMFSSDENQAAMTAINSIHDFHAQLFGKSSTACTIILQAHSFLHLH